MTAVFLIRFYYHIYRYTREFYLVFFHMPILKGKFFFHQISKENSAAYYIRARAIFGQIRYFIFISILKGGQLLKEIICSSRRKFFLSTTDCLRKGFTIQESKQEVTKIMSLCKNDRKAWRSPIHIHIKFQVFL